MHFFRFILLWLVLAVLFSLFNSAFEKYEILLQSSNALFFTSGFYLSYFLLIRRYLYRNKTRVFFALYFLLIICLSIISIFWTYEIYVIAKKKFFVENYWNEPVFLISNAVLNLLVISSLLSFRILKDKMDMQHKLESVEKEKVKTELEFLKAQINPHFLFNSLNNILFQIEKSNTEARETLLKFSEMLRYQLYDCSVEFIPIEKEIVYLRNYIEIQLLRKTDKYKCDFKVGTNVSGFSIAPLLLIPFVENAFKYISNRASGNNQITIKLDFHEGELLFSVVNDTDHSQPLMISESKGIGLANVRRRLELLYKNNYELDITQFENQYAVCLKLKGLKA
ncbi:MAG: histidine kinase [Bacteroidia bacterium]